MKTNSEEISLYRADALSYGDEFASYPKMSYNSDSIVYLYGDLTINDYKTTIGLSDYSLYVDIVDNNSFSQKAYQFYDFPLMKPVEFLMS